MCLCLSSDRYNLMYMYACISRNRALWHRYIPRFTIFLSCCGNGPKHGPSLRTVQRAWSRLRRRLAKAELHSVSLWCGSLLSAAGDGCSAVQCSESKLFSACSSVVPSKHTLFNGFLSLCDLRLLGPILNKYIGLRLRPSRVFNCCF